MASSSVKDNVLQRIDAELDAWKSLVAEVGESRMNEPGPMGDWTFLDLVVHLTGWRRYSISRLEAAMLDDGPATPPWPPGLANDDEINDWMRDTARQLTLSQILKDHEQTFRHLGCVIEEMPDGMLTAREPFPWLAGDTLANAITSGRYFAHLHQEHETQVRAWLTGTAGKDRG